MKMWFPVFGSDPICHICKKWCVLADTKDDAFNKADAFWKGVSDDCRAYFYPFNHWVGPLYQVVESPEINGIHII